MLLNTAVNGYSVLTHESIIDHAWSKQIAPLLVKKYPATSDSDLVKCRAFAYGGAIMPDMGYYPFGSKLFTDLVHYVRSGDFIETLLSECNNVNEYAFALGALAHYNADVYGHPIGVNPSVPLTYTETECKFGSYVTYEKDPTAHRRMEFGFDVLQVAKGSYLPDSYHDFIGFQLSEGLLARVVQKVYGLDLYDLFMNFDLAVGTFRWSVKSLFPELTKAAWVTKKNEIKKLHPKESAKHYQFKMSRKQFHKEYGTKYERPGIKAKLISGLVIVFPKIGLFRALKFKAPDQRAEALFLKSYDATLNSYNNDLKKLFSNAELKLPNKDLDTGEPEKAGEYSLSDDAYKELVFRLAKNPANVTTDIRKSIKQFYKDCKPEVKNEKAYVEFNAALQTVLVEPEILRD